MGKHAFIKPFAEWRLHFWSHQANLSQSGCCLWKMPVPRGLAECWITSEFLPASYMRRALRAAEERGGMCLLECFPRQCWWGHVKTEKQFGKQTVHFPGHSHMMKDYGKMEFVSLLVPRVLRVLRRILCPRWLERWKLSLWLLASYFIVVGHSWA